MDIKSSILFKANWRPSKASIVQKPPSLDQVFDNCFRPAKRKGPPTINYDYERYQVDPTIKHGSPSYMNFRYGVEIDLINSEQRNAVQEKLKKEQAKLQVSKNQMQQRHSLFHFGSPINCDLWDLINKRNESLIYSSKLHGARVADDKAGVVLTRKDYYCYPSIEELDKRGLYNGHCFVNDFKVGHLKYGFVVFQGWVDVAGLNLDEIVHFSEQCLVVYPDKDLPLFGHGLNCEREVTLFDVWIPGREPNWNNFMSFGDGDSGDNDWPVLHQINVDLLRIRERESQRKKKWSDFLKVDEEEKAFVEKLNVACKERGYNFVKYCPVLGHLVYREFYK